MYICISNNSGKRCEDSISHSKNCIPRESASMSEQKPYIVSARKYRPATFKTVVGQRALTATLKNSIDSRRLAQAYLFCGPRGVGKTSCARIFAKTINCLNPTPDGEACGECESCRAIDQGVSFNLVELDAASNNSVDDIRSITEQVNVPPQSGRYRIFIIDEVHMLSNAAFNAFLKTLEEPPKYVIFILATTEKHKVIPTILSRCQIYDFKRITVNDIVEHLEYVATEEGISTDRNALGVIALKADGAMRDALSIFDQVAASSRGNVTYENTIENLNVLDYDYYFRLVDSFREGDIPGVLMIYKEIRDKGFDSLFLINGLAAHIRDLMVAADQRTIGLLETSEEVARKYVEQAKTLPVQWYYAAMKLLSDGDLNYRTATSKRLLVELTLIRLCQLLKPATPPFDMEDRRLPLGDPSAQRRPGNLSETTHDGGIVPIAQTKESESTAPGSAKGDGPKSYSIASQPHANVSISQSRTVKPTVDLRQNVDHTSSPQRSASPMPSRPKVAKRPTPIRLNETFDSNGKSAPTTMGRRNEPVSQEAFMDAWGGFIASNPSLHILVNAMRVAKLEPCGEQVYKIVVEHPAQLQAFELSMARLLDYLRTHLNNDYLTLQVVMSEKSEGLRHLPPREYLKQVLTENPVLAKFLNELDGEIE